jgi:hypothetical protein
MLVLLLVFELVVAVGLSVLDERRLSPTRYPLVDPHPHPPLLREEHDPQHSVRDVTEPARATSQRMMSSSIPAHRGVGFTRRNEPAGRLRRGC